MKIETERLIITRFTMDMAEAVHLNSLDEDNRRFVPDEVFETVEEAADTVGFLMRVYKNGDGPLVYPTLLKDGTYIGVCKLKELCGTDYPWPCDATVTEDGSILVIMTDERQDQSADELIAFKISGF